MTTPGSLYYHGEDFRFTASTSIEEQFEFFKKALEIYDIFHFSNMHGLKFGSALHELFAARLGAYGEIKLLKGRGKKIVYSNNGCLDGVSQTTFNQWKPFPTCDICRWKDVASVCSDERNLEWGKIRNELTDYQCIFGGNRADYNDDLRVHEEPSFYCLDPEFWRPDLAIPQQYLLENSDTVKIYHAVGNYDLRSSSVGTNIKCTHIYLPLIKRLKAEGYPVELVFAKDIPNQEVRFLQVQADIIVDMLTYGFFGANIREGLMLGKTCVCFLRPEWLETMRQEIPEYVEELPVVSATPETIHDVLVDLITDHEKRRDIGRKSREFALKWHSAEATARRFDRIYSDLLGCLAMNSSKGSIRHEPDGDAKLKPSDKDMYSFTSGRGFEGLQHTDANSSSHKTVTNNGTKTGRTVVMLVGDSRIDRRVLDEARSLNNAGYRVTVIAGLPPKAGDRHDEECYPDLEIIRIDTKRAEELTGSIDPERFRAAISCCSKWNFFDYFFQHMHFLVEALARPADIIVAHDLPQLPAAVIAAAYHGAYLAYDAHELYPAQAFESNNRVLAEIDAWLAPFADQVITVNQSIASEMARRYLIDRPEVVLNLPSHLPSAITNIPRDALRSELGIPQDCYILLFQGNLIPATRNLENLVLAMKHVCHKNVVLVLMGADGGALKTLVGLAEQAGTLSRRVFFKGAVPQKELIAYTAMADAGIIQYPSIDLNTYFCTPNKLFEFIVAELPILANDLPELCRFVEGNRIGLNMPMTTPVEIAQAIDKFFMGDLLKFRDQLSRISGDYTWQAREAEFVRIYDEMLRRPSRQSLLKSAEEARKTGDIGQARQLYAGLLSDCPGNVHVVQRLADIEQAAGEAEKAASYLEFARHRAETVQRIGNNDELCVVPPPVQKQVERDRKRILVLLHYPTIHPPLRVTIRDHIYCFDKYSDCTVHYLNLQYIDELPEYIASTSYDLILFHTVFASARWGGPEYFRTLYNSPTIRRLCRTAAIKAVLPQDEFLHTDVLSEFINDMGIDHVFSVSPPSEWPLIYAGIDRTRTTIHQVLTGYIDDDTLERISALSRDYTDRPIDVGYRAWHAAYWLGRHGQLKWQIAELFNQQAPAGGFVTNISTNEKDTFLDDDWYRFMLQCKFFIGVDGGASILDRDGSIKACTEAYLIRFPNASFEEVEAACFPGVDGSFRLFAISPRQLEACATRTCQVLVEGDYNGILKPWEHYIPLKKDFSNLEEVFAAMRDEPLRQAIVERAYKDIVASGIYSYRNFVTSLLETVFT